MSLTDRIAEANRLDRAGLVPFEIAGVEVGMAQRDFAERLAGWPDVFVLGPTLAINARIASPEDRTAAVAGVLASLRREGAIPGWRDEMYPVGREFDEPPLLSVERAAATLLGIRTYAVNLNGFVRRENGLFLWLQHRAKTKPICPDKLDVLVSGGQPTGVDPFENLVKECGEEAGIHEPLARRAQFAGTVSFRSSQSNGVHHGHYFNYDLELSADFRPDNQDGEVEAFYCWPAGRVVATLSGTEDFAFDSAIVVIDFLIRHGIIGREHPEYATLQEATR